MTTRRIEGFRLSPQQEHLREVCPRGGEAPYRAACAVAIDGDLNPEALAAALRRAVERHEILRTTFRQLPGMSVPLQVIQAEPAVALRRLDWSDRNATEQESGIDALLAALRRAPLDLEQGPLMDAVLVALGERRWMLLLHLSAFCADAATLRNLVRELAEACTAGRHGSATPGEAAQYADFSEWQNQFLEQEGELARGYWQGRRILPLLDVRLPFEREPAGPASFATWPVSPVPAAGLDALASHLGASAATVLLSAWYVLLWRLTGETGIVVGAVCDGRTFEEMADALGPFARSLPLQCEIAEGDSFAEVLAQVDASMAELCEWQDHFSWRHLGAANGAPGFFPYSFELDELPAARSSAEIAVSVVRWSLCIDRFRLKLAGFRRGSALELSLHYEEGAYERAAIQRLAEWFLALLAEGVARPRSPLGDLDLRSAAEKRLLADINRTGREHRAAGTLDRLVREQAARTPDRIALVVRDRALTFAGLAGRAARLAHLLRRLGVGAETCVALCLERSPEMVIGILGVLMAGGAYVPLDPDDPAERRSFLLEDSEAVVLLTREPLLARCAGFPGRIVCLGRDEPETAKEAPTPPPPERAAPENLAYVIYTSGSTGRPKGVMISHRAIVNRLLWMQRRFPLAETDAVLQKTPYGFDASVWEIFTPLLAGARLALAEPGEHRDAASLLATIADHQVTVLQLVPSFLPAFLDEEEVGSLGRALRRLFCGGEALSAGLAERLFHRLPGAGLCNLYGPTEVSIDATFHPCAPGGSESPVPIGLPLDNVGIHVLDARHRPVPLGLPGELSVSGAGLARGYIGRPDLTAERFVPHPWGAAGERLYRTGDLVRHARDGILEFLGRIDGQIKIRGFRIELGEIEAALIRHPAVREAAVAARTSAAGGLSLAAYVALRPGQDAGPGELRNALREILPDFMVPAVFARLDALPRLPSGKLDRRALPEPDALQASEDAAFVAPRTPVEELLAAVWADLLHRDRVGIHDDFFDAGGHSLLATQLVSRVREAFRVELKLRAVFEAPTVAGLAHRLLAEQRSGRTLETPPVQPVRRTGDPPLSFAQQRLWFLDQLEPGSAAYNLVVAVRLEGRLDVRALAAGFGEVVRRHESLRTTFRAVDGDPVQRIAAPGAFALPLVDLSGLGGGMGAEALRLETEEACRPFDLERGPLFRPRLLRLGVEEHAVLTILHHIIGDGWSTGVFVREVGTLYQAFSAGRPSPLPELPVQYADYAVWQRRWLAGEDLAAEVDVWRRRLAGLPALLDLPTDRPRPSVRSAAGAARRVRLPDGLTAVLRALARSTDTTLFMVLLAGFQVLLARLSGQEDLGVGIPVAGRNRLALEGLIGFFANTLVLRAGIAGDAPVHALLEQVRGQTLEAFAHQDLPFEKLVEELAPERSLAHTPLFQAMFAFQGLTIPAAEPMPAPGLALAPIALPARTAKFDLNLMLTETALGIAGSLEYAVRLFDAVTVDRIASHLESLLGDMAGRPEARLGDLALLRPWERRQILAEWNDTTVAVPDRCIHELFEEQVRRAPDAPAVLGGGEALTYRQLERRANQLARHLAYLRAGPGTLVAVYLDRSPEMAVALLGILKCGAAYVPLDPLYPAARIAWILSALGIRHLVTQHARLPVIERLGGEVALADVVCLGPAAPEGPERLGGARLWHRASLDVLPGDRPLVRTGGDDLAYIVFTSGTSGTPKGVMVCHRPVIHLIDWVNREFGVGPGDRLLFVTSLCFDLSVYDLFGILVAGGSVRVATDAEQQDPEALLRILLEEPITFWDSAPAALQQLAPFLAGPGPGTGDLRLVFLSGDWIPVSLPGQIRTAFPGARVIGLGGATEATVWSNFFSIGDVDPSWRSIPYGRPIQNARYHVLDASLGTCPIGVAGDLYIGGECLSAGYVQDAVLTAGKYIPDPFGERPGGRLYRTGDRARHLRDGNLEFLGRHDQQVKIRGFRVELGEIETVLRGHPAVREAVVLADRSAAGDPRLVGYVVAREDGEPAAADLRSFLRDKLPDYMIPSAFLMLDSLPVTANGKLDRKELPSPDADWASRELVPPATPIQEMLAGIWAEVLGLERIGIRDNFFDRGGNSLTATRVTSRVSRDLRLQLPVRALFAAPTIESLAGRIAEALAGRPARSDELLEAGEPLPPCEDRERAPLSFAQRRLWFLDRLVPGSTAYSLPFAVCLDGALDPAVLSRCVGEILRRHEVLRARFGDEGDEVIQIVEPLSAPWLPLVDLASLPAAEGRARALGLRREEARRPFDLRRGPLVRPLLVRLHPAEHWLLFTMHHAVTDAWSIAILTREMSALYRAFAAGRPSPLLELPIQYADFAAWQRRALRGEILEAHITYWRQQLQGAPATLDLPADRPRPPLPTHRGDFQEVRLGEGLTATLEHLGREAGATLFMVLLAGLQTLLGRSSGQTDILVGSPVANRTRPELEGLIGFFANTLVLRADLSGDPGFLDLLERVKRATFEAFDHQDLPFEKLVDELELARGLSHSPLFQVTFALQNVPTESAVSLGRDLRLKTIGKEGGSAKYDLGLSLWGAGRELSGSLEYSTDLFDPTTIGRLSGHFRVLLESIAADPRRRLSDLGLLSAQELHQLLGEWGAPGRSSPCDSCLHQVFANWARRTPDATAVTCDGAALSHGELDRQANRLAHRLLNAGVVPGSRVCLATERGLGSAAGILGILKAGCAYVPLDPSSPRERLAWVLEDAGAAALVSEAGMLERLPAWPGPVLPLEEGGGLEESPRVAVTPDWPAYVIYTSGSTGRPKGVIVTHGDVLRLFSATEEWFGFGAEDVWTQFHSCAFDFSVWELWGALLHGGRLVVVPYWVSRAPETFRDLLVREGVTVLNQTPSAFRHLLQALGTGEAPALRWVIFGGEVLDPRSLAPWWARDLPEGSGRAAGLVNMYGITETTVHVTFRRLAPEDAGAVSGSPIGTPIPDMAVYLLDRAGRPVPLGASGEIHVGGAGVARGYLERPELTAERFVPDPFGDLPGARLYRSGDLARWRARGELEFLGRIDHQVKIRGFRIEPGEIEAELNRHPAVRDSAVLARDEGPGDRRLVAYVVPAPGESPPVDGLRHFLQDRLPEHMVPAAFVTLPALPLTSNGKLDRAALPAPDGVRPDLGVSFALPRNPVEEVLCAIWSQVLRVDRVGVQDNFFALGGDSILSLRVVALAAERGLDLALPDLFRHQTLAGLAEGLRFSAEAAAAPARRSVEPFSLVSSADRARLPDGLDDAYPLSMLQAGMLYHMALTPEFPLYHNVGSWHVRGRLDPGPFREAVRRVVARHPILRTSFDLTGYSEPLQLVHRQAVLPVDVEDLRPLPDAEQEEWIAALVAREKRQVFDLSRAPQLRFLVHLRSESSFQLTLVENHAIFDGWSLHATLAEIFELYFALLAGGSPPEEPPLALTYRDFVHLERQTLASPEAASFWDELLSDDPAAALPSWLARRESFRGEPRIERRSVPLAAELLAGLQALARGAAVPLKSILLAAHLKVLGLVSGTSDVMTGLVANGRMEEPQGDQVRGLFLNMLPFRAQLGARTWKDLARATFARERQVLPFRRYPLAALQRQRGSGLLLEVGFNYIHFHVVRDLLSAGRAEILGSRMAEGGSFKMQCHFGLRPDGRQLQLHLEHDPRWVAGERIEDLAGLYLRVLGTMAEEPDAFHDRLCLLPPAEQHRLLREWQDTTAPDAPSGRCIHEIVEAQAERRPDAIALTCGGTHLTFAGLGARAARVARCLRGLGVGPDTIVGLCAERSFDLVIGMLGVLQAGGAYLSLDPAYPRDRLAFMLGDAFAQAAAPILATQRELVDRLLGDGPLAARLRVVRLDAEGEEGACDAGDGLTDLPSPPSPQHLAYVLYTSGSTGRPKAVGIEHRGIPNLTAAQARAFDVRPGDRVLQFASPSFDASVSEVWVTLAAGATLVLAPSEVLLPSPEMMALLYEQAVTHATLPPAVLALLPGEDLPALRTLVVAGEACPPDLALRWGAGRRLINAYGPTEATVCATLAVLPGGGCGGPLPIGRPLGDVRVHLLGGDLHPVPAGAPAELYIGGISLARGYLGQPSLTAERFVPDPFGGSGERLYRSGDLARFLPDGAIEFLGRIDHQVKLRGIRVEPGEIEAVLASHPAVRSAAVVARDDLPGGRRLVGFVAPAPGAEIQVAELRELARRRLPHFMVPSAFVVLGDLPTAPGGKVDRLALGRLPLDGQIGSAPSSPPETELERQVADVWGEVLGVPQVGLHDNFFDLGGHSLALVQVQRRLREQLGCEVAAVDLLRATTVASLARHLASASEAAEATKQGGERAESRREMRDRRQRRLESRSAARETVENV